MTLSNQHLGRNIKKARTTTTTTKITEIMGPSGIITAPQSPQLPQLFFVCFMLTIHQTLNNKAQVFKLCLKPEPLERSAEMY